MKEQVWSGTGPWVAVLSGLAVLLAIYLVDAWAVLWVPVSMFALFVCFRVRVAQVLSLAMTCASLLLLGLHWRLDAYPLVRVLLTLSIMLILLSVCFARGHRTTQQLRETGALLDSSLKAMAQGLQVVGPDGRVKLFNDRFCELLDLPRELLERRPRLSELVEFQHARGDFGTNFERVEQGARVYVASHVLGFEVPEGPRTYTRRTPAGRHLQISALPLPGGDVVRTFTDVTHYEQVNEQLQIVLQDHEALRKREMDRSREQLIAALTQLAQYRDNETGQHIVRTQMYIRVLARSARTMGYRAEQLGDEIIDMMVKAAPMHDLGKIGVPDHILHKPGPLEPEEAIVMRKHAMIGEVALKTAARGGSRQASLLLMAARIAGGHHENWDGSGYPRGLRGADIPLEAQLMGLADVYDALTTARPYKPAWSHDQALVEVRRLAGVKFDPQLVRALEREEQAFQAIARSLADPANG